MTENRRNGFYYKNGKLYVSVTKVLEIIAKPALIGWAAREAARAALANPTLTEQEAASIIYSKRDAGGARGKMVHSFCEMYQRGVKIDLDKIPEEFKGYARAFLSFLVTHEPEFVYTEQEVYSNKHGYAGTLDFIMKGKDGQLIVGDIKTSKEVYKENFLQLEAYRNAVEEMGLAEVHRTAVLLLSDDGYPTFKEGGAPLEKFLAAKELWEWANADLLDAVNNPPKLKKEVKNG